jgi:hypothetical protein
MENLAVCDHSPALEGSAIVAEIEAAFAGVQLDGGISLKQTQVIDNYGRDCTSEQFTALPRSEVTDDWKRIPVSMLDEADSLAHLDDRGVKYYIPALMLRLLDNYDPGSMMTIGTLSILYPRTESGEYVLSLLTDPQKRAIARFMKELPMLVGLEGEDITIVDRAFRNYWSKFLGGNL